LACKDGRYTAEPDPGHQENHQDAQTTQDRPRRNDRSTGTGSGAGTTATADPTGQPHGQRVCATAAVGEAACHAVVLVDANGQRVSPMGQPLGQAGTSPTTISGKTPSDIQSAYKLTGLNSGGRTVAIVDAYG